MDLDENKRLLELRERLSPAVEDGERWAEMRKVLKAYGWDRERDNGKAYAWRLANGGGIEPTGLSIHPSPRAKR